MAKNFYEEEKQEPINNSLKYASVIEEILGTYSKYSKEKREKEKRKQKNREKENIRYLNYGSELNRQTLSIIIIVRHICGRMAYV